MISDFTPGSLEECLLWRRLNEPFNDEPSNRLAKFIAPSVRAVCQLAVDRMKLMPAFHAEFTLHDETHLLRVTELMARVIPSEVLQNVLNPVEVALLILSAHFHDVGMIPDTNEILIAKESREFSVAKDNWLVEFPGFRDALRIIADREADPVDKKSCACVVAEHEVAILQRFFRDNHARRSAEFVKSRLGADERLRVGTGHLADSLALLCVSHNWPSAHLSDTNGLLLDKAIGTFPANLQYLAVVLRLADILDFDRERTPDELYRCIGFTSSVSIAEWEKHRSVEGWKIDRDAIRFECACQRPEYERAIHRFLGFIDEELTVAHGIVRRFPAQFSNYKFDLPFRTDRSRITAKNDAYIQASDLEISLSRDEIVRLLMTEKLYGHPSLAIRELLQNAWDALRHRSTIVKRDEQMDWGLGLVEFEHGVNAEGREFVRCTDNGVGMDQNILKNFLFRAGRSYYRSPEFERERIIFRKKGADFDPCARFGIGFMSAFMLGDQINIRTRRYQGLQGGLGQPLVVEVNGVGGLIVLREGTPDQAAGTTVEIIGRRNSGRFLRDHDQVKLVDTIYAFAIAGEFPVVARCTIKEIEDEISLPAGVAKVWHPLLESDAKKKAVFTQEFSEIDSRLSGKIIAIVPLMDDGRLAIANDIGGWVMDEEMSSPSYIVGQGKRIWGWGGRTCLDGILVAGPQGRGRRDSVLVSKEYSNPINLGENTFVLDVRGELKPELLPHRAPPPSHFLFSDCGPGWRRLRRLVARAHGKLWEKVIERFSGLDNIKVLWQLLALHHVEIDALRRGFVWSRLAVPSLTREGRLFFRPLSELPSIPFAGSAKNAFSYEEDGAVVGIDNEMSSWKSQNGTQIVFETVRKVVFGMASLDLEKGQPVLRFFPPEAPEDYISSRIVFDHFDRVFAIMPFGRELEDVLVAETAERFLNQRHPVIRWLLENQESRDENLVFAFLHGLAGALLEDGAIRALLTGNIDDIHHNWHFSLLGYRFRNVDMNALDSDLRPPYCCWHPDFGKVEITGEMLKKLSEIQAIDWGRRREERYL